MEDIDSIKSHNIESSITDINWSNNIRENKFLQPGSLDLINNGSKKSYQNDLSEQSLESHNDLEQIPGEQYMKSSPLIDEVVKKKKKISDTSDIIDTKKLSNVSSDEKKIINLRKNIRDVMDENQLDTNTLVAQRAESERLARVAEQQKVVREYQRQTAVNRQFVRTQNRVLSLLQSGNTFAKVTNLSDKSQLIDQEKNISESLTSSNEKILHESLESTYIDEQVTKFENKSLKDCGQQYVSDVVTIEDSSSEDDCILLSDDEDLEEEIEDDPSNSGLHVKDTYNLPDQLGRVVVNVGHPESEEDIFLAPQIAKTIKPHQIGGVRFLYDNIIESTNRFSNSSGFGCILAHSMGLGKTLQIICFCDIFLRHTSSKTVLCVMPINTLQNWVSEFNMWIPKKSSNPDEVRPRHFDIFVLNDQQKTLSARAKVILKWADEGGVLLIGYELFRLLALKIISKRKGRSNKNTISESTLPESNNCLMDSIHRALVRPGPDLVICDEGHRIKNSHAGISLALKQIRTRRRIVLTGYPLQNNLLEYWCMVDFVRPNYLGTRTEFCNMFERPIQNGQCIDSTPEDIKLMRYRAHVLHSLLVGFVQRRSHVVLQQTLPQKLEYVILTRMTAFQRQLYETFMNDVVRSKTVPNPLKAFAVCCKIWNHPDVLYNFLKKRETDLDLEIDENEVTTEQVPPVAELNAPKSLNFSENLNISDETDTMKCKGNGSTFSSEQQKQHKDKLSILSKSQSRYLSDSTQSYMENQSKTHNYYSETYNQQSNIHSATNEFSGNNYWQEPSASFFAQSNIGFPSKPDYVGIMVKPTEQTTNEENAINSSEIVDLDTKEIKTVETNIDMNPVIKKETSQDNERFNLKNPMQKYIPDSTLQKKVPECENEKETQKTKSDESIPYEWAIELMKKYKPDLISNSPKMEIFFCIINESINLGDRVLLFSQSLLTLNLIEKFLQSQHLPESNSCWSRNVSYFRLDGSTTSQEREKLVTEFNKNKEVKLFLISTRAGSLGINLVGANRVIVFDASWNPCHDTQAVYRIYRYGQEKPCYIYRIVMDKCLEKKIYDRQIKKQGMSDRVVDECNPDAHLSMKDVTNLCHDFDNENKIEAAILTQPIENFLDPIIQKVIEKHKNSLSKEPFYHESLLIDRKEKKLSQAEKRQAHRSYELEKKAATKNTLLYSTNKIQYRVVRNDGTVISKPVASIRPMQTTKSNTTTKTAGVRSTRWIPADVWQRQGMTAQEMTLPLDVVIPTNSSDKSNIILKAGQRVMVLKSAKGIYMQLDSGKIIAIRTSSKCNETVKQGKEEIIDITSESDNVSDAKSTTLKEPIEEVNNKNTLLNAANTIEDKLCLKEEFNNCKESKISSHHKYESSSLISKKNWRDPLPQKTTLKTVNSSVVKTSHSSVLNRSYYKNQCSPNIGLIESCTMSSRDDSELETLHRNEKVIDSFSSCSGNVPVSHQFVPKEVEINDNFSNYSPEIQNKALTNNSTSGTFLVETTKNELQYSFATSQKGGSKTSLNGHPNLSDTDSNPKKDVLISENHLQTSSNTPCESNVGKCNQTSQYTSLSQNLQHSKPHIYIPRYNTNGAQCNNSTLQPGSVQENNFAPNSFLSSRNIQNYAQYYDTYDRNNIPAACEYSAPFGDYPMYSSYNHPRFHSHFHASTYGSVPAPSIAPDPYHMHWSRLISPTPISEQFNTMYPTTYSQNAAQPNQWHHQ